MQAWGISQKPETVYIHLHPKIWKLGSLQMEGCLKTEHQQSHTSALRLDQVDPD